MRPPTRGLAAEKRHDLFGVLRMSDTATSNATEVREKIEDVLASIRPAVRADGGDIEFVDYHEVSGLVQVRMLGACYACPMSIATLRAGIEQRLRLVAPEVRAVEAV